MHSMLCTEENTGRGVGAAGARQLCDLAALDVKPGASRRARARRQQVDWSERNACRAEARKRACAIRQLHGGPPMGFTGVSVARRIPAFKAPARLRHHVEHAPDDLLLRLPIAPFGPTANPGASPPPSAKLP